MSVYNRPLEPAIRTSRQNGTGYAYVIVALLRRAGQLLPVQKTIFVNSVPMDLGEIE